MRTEVACTDSQGVTLTIQANQIELKKADGSAAEIVPYRYDEKNDRYLLTGPYNTLKVTWTKRGELDFIQMDRFGFPMRPVPTMMVLTPVSGPEKTFNVSCRWK